jgi:shikimate kinase
MILWLVGMMGSGKTTVGRLIASATGVEFRDTEAEVETPFAESP